MDIKINTGFINKRLDGVFSGMKEVYSPRSKESVAKAIFTISSKEFVRQLNGKAIRSPKRYHHLYEWGQIGDTQAKLFQIRRTAVSGGNLKISPYFLKSKSYVPIPKELTKPGKKGKFVSKKFIFADKAQFMELGEPTKPFAAKGKNKALAMMGNNGKPLFIRNPRQVQIMHPGGKLVRGSFFKVFEEWFRSPAKIEAAVNKSGYYRVLEKAIATTITKTPENNIAAVRSVIVDISNRYSEGASRV